MSQTDRLPNWIGWTDLVCRCMDCGIRTNPGMSAGRTVDGTWEWYMVHDHMWHAAHADGGYLCIGCLERRIGRTLVPADFPPCRANAPSPLDTPRLAARKGQQNEQDA